MSRAKVLVVDDEPDIRELLSLTLERMQVDCETAADVGSAQAALEAEEFGLCLTDMRLPDGDGLDLVAYIQKHHPQIPVAMITAHGNMECAIQALKLGAFDFLSKPVDLEVLRTLIRNALRLPAHGQGMATSLIGDSLPMQTIRKTIAKLARSQTPIYISGESGTGKELAARLIHEQGPRAGSPFVPVNCGAIPPELMESELFGHIKGAFTGASSDRPGLFQAADGGSLFLDEIADLPLSMQVKLLRAIQEKAVRPVGAQHEVSVDVRILSATHKDLAAQVASGEFRQDLFYRINVIELHMPALRERRDDIPVLVQHILTRLAPDPLQRPELAPGALELLARHGFPGNVRELENMLERALTLCEGKRIEAGDFNLPQPAPVTREGTDQGLGNYMDEIEKQKILEALEATHWNRTQAAKRLGISFRALRYRLEKLGIEV